MTLVLSQEIPGRIAGGGKVIYYGHCIEPIAFSGAFVTAGTPICHIRGVGNGGADLGIPGHVEMGWADATDVGHYTMLAISNGECPKGRDCETQAGHDFKDFLQSIQGNRITV
jgi:hypothetical protein